MKRNACLNAVILLGLSSGLTAFALIFYYFQFQTSFDKFHPQADRLYRVVMTRFVNGERVSERSDTYPMLAPALNEQIPELYAQQMMYSFRGGTLMDFGHSGESELRDDLKVLSVDPGFFDLFSLELTVGGTKELTQPFTGLISTQLADLYFPDINPVGQTWTEDDGSTYRIIGVFKPWEENSHLDFDLIKSFESIGARHNADLHRTSWYWDRMKVYVLLNKDVSEEGIEEKIKDIIVRNKPVEVETDLEEFISLQPVNEINLHSDFETSSFIAKKSNRVYGLLLIGSVILIIAWINFINFSLSLGFERLRAIGVQKSLGAGFSYFVKKQLTESLMVNTLALALAVSFWQIFKPVIDRLAEINPTYQPDEKFYLVLIGVSLIGVLLTFIAPVIQSRRISILHALKGKLGDSNSGTPFMRKALVVFQWVVSISLILSVFVVQDQLAFLNEVERGVRTEGILVFKGPRLFDYDRFSTNPDIIKHQLELLPGVNSVASSYAVPGDTPYAYEIREEGKPFSANVFIPEHQVDANYINVYDHRLLAGRNFDASRIEDSSAAILNVSAVKALFGDIALDDVLGKRITSPESEYIRTVIGVIEDYYHQSPEVAHFPMNFVFDPESRGFYSVHYTTNDFQALLQQIESLYAEQFPGNIFHSFLLNDFYAEYRETEERLSSLLSAFGLIAIILSIVGVVALTLLDLGKSMKDLSIRKVLGASISNLFYKIGISSVKRYVLACMIAFPLSYWLMQNWLKDYANRIQMDIKYIVPALLLLVILVIVLYVSSSNELRKNPTDYLKEK
ncbi:ABC transporter permease [Roseivirga sp.]|uniref:ABC transporter permease n=1 Tax=Roseivirga sp. TaxID=1964215 RepID=UPI003B525B9F